MVVYAVYKSKMTRLSMQESSRSESLTRHETGFISLMLSLQLALSKQCCIQAKANGVTPDSQPKLQGNVANKNTKTDRFESQHAKLEGPPLVVNTNKF